MSERHQRPVPLYLGEDPLGRNMSKQERDERIEELRTYLIRTREELRDSERGGLALQRALREHDERTRAIRDRERDICREIDLTAQRVYAHRDLVPDPADPRYRDRQNQGETR